MYQMVGGTGIIGEDIICPLSKMQNNYEKVVVMGDGDVTLPDSLKAPFEMLELYGRSAQEATTGAQLLNPNRYDADKTENGVSVTKNPDGKIGRASCRERV